MSADSASAINPGSTPGTQPERPADGCEQDGSALRPMVLGIHGFAPKPPVEQLSRSWRQSLEEGLGRNVAIAEPRFDFEMVYWADLLHPHPIRDDPEPYRRAPGDDPLPCYSDDWLDEMVADVVGIGESMLDQAMKLLGFHQRTARLLTRICEDCERYIAEPELRGTIRERLHGALARHRGRPLVLIAHSVGSVIAYEVLRELEPEDGEPHDPWIHHFLTVGSPMGFPYITHELSQKRPPNRVPTTVRRWTNFADRRDPATLDVHLRDDFPRNRYGVSIDDDLVINTYTDPEGARNSHKIFGYLRTPELSRRLAEMIPR